MKLSDAKRLFFGLRAENRVEVCEEHVIGAHPERAYTVDEVISLIRASGIFQDSTDPKYLGERFYWRIKDVTENDVRLVIEFDEDEDGQLILVVSAGERQ